MDPYERFHRRSLRDVLVQQGALSNEQADELIDAAHQANEPFATVVLDAGALTSWDLAKTVATHYQMPVLPLVGYRFDKAIAQGLPASLLYQHQVLPVGRFGRTWSFVAEAQEVTRLLRENVKVMDVSSDTAWQSIFDEAQQNVLSESKVAPLPPPKTE
jgi:hypothetical protein